MRTALTLLLLLGSAALPAQSLELLRRLPHSGYSEGLTYHENYLWHALPEQIVKIEPTDGRIVETYKPASKYSESVTWFQGKLWNVSFSDNGIYAGTLRGGKLEFVRVGETPEAHAWGLTHDGKHLIFTGNFSKKIYFWDPKSRKVVRELETPIKDVEDLAWDGVGIWSSSFSSHKGKIFRIDPESGKISGFFELPDPESCPVIDGIAYHQGELWVTGKHCPSIWVLRKPTERAISSSSP
ncbi:MAG: glutaminyl-peptide cyclotransferase [Bdellovibrionales bacterium]|nr:glutaminyl-peptide cyclotransferase [Bdellovibrionales bacterium]MCB0418535.1 glutaminyl-peptide cyclotransferase [Bdellovibrionales bacterium]MCB9254339.1 glutaminyl-peptide cyclotransferase [Pseudobdellovibrionaceae bacterium]